MGDKPEPIFTFDSWQGKRVQVFADDESLRGRTDLFHTWTRQIKRATDLDDIRLTLSQVISGIYRVEVLEEVDVTNPLGHVVTVFITTPQRGS